jgi:hypothetical protein
VRISVYTNYTNIDNITFYFEKKQYVNLALKKEHLRVEGISFDIQILCQFRKLVNGDYKTESHSK